MSAGNKHFYPLHVDQQGSGNNPSGVTKKTNHQIENLVRFLLGPDNYRDRSYGGAMAEVTMIKASTFVMSSIT